MNFVWHKPVLSFYRERIPRENEPFAVAKAIKLEVTRSEEGIFGKIYSFFPLMGSLDYISSGESKQENHVICWFDDTIEDLTESFRRLTGVTFSSNVNCIIDKRGKKTYQAEFKALQGKLK